MNILLTGGAGYIGSHVTRQLSEEGHKVTVVDDLSTGFSDSLINDETLVVGNVGDCELLKEILLSHKIEAIMHFAGSIVVSESVKKPAEYYKNNTFNTLKLAEVAGLNKVKHFIFSSTAAVYGANPEGLASETTAISPCNPYGSSKWMAEKILQDLSSVYNFKLGILRYFNVAGADPQGRMGQKTKDATHLIKICSEAACGLRDKVEIYGNDYPTKDGTCLRDYIHVEDLAQAHLETLKYLTDSTEKEVVFNVGYGQGYSVREVLERTLKLTGAGFKIVEGPRRDGDPAVIIADAKKIQEVLGWKPKYNSLDQIILDAWRWEQKWRKH